MPPQQRSLRVLLPLGQRGRWPDGLPARGQRHVARPQGLAVRTRQECLKVNLVLGKGAPALEVELKATLQLLDGRKILLETDGLLSRAIQHETDHLNGVLFVDRLPTATKLSMKRRLKRLTV